jgi:type II secretory pathway pseudopilin PulG
MTTSLPLTNLRRGTPGERGYALLGLIIAMMVLAVVVTAAAPNAKMQVQRQVEMEMYFRGEQMAEAIARYYTGGKLSPAGLVVRTPPPPYGYLTELKKLRDGVTMGSQEVFLARRSAFVDPLTGDEWEPVRIGDPRLRKFFVAWQRATGRPVPPIYTSYLGAGNIVNTNPDADSPDGPGSQDDGFDDEEDDDWDDEEDDWEDEDEDEEEDEGEEFEEIDFAPADGAFIRPAMLQQTPSTGTTTDGERRPPTVQRPGQDGSVFSNGSTRLGPIIGVVSKAKGTAVRTRFGVEKYEEMIFIYIPMTRPGIPGQAPNTTGLPQTVEPPRTGAGVAPGEDAPQQPGGNK